MDCECIEDKLFLHVSGTLRKGAVLTALGTGSVASWSPVPRLATAAAREFEHG